MRSPVDSHLSATLQGLPVVRAFRAEDRHSSAWFMYLTTARLFVLHLDWLIAVYFCVCIATAFLMVGLEVEGISQGKDLKNINIKKE